MPSQHMKISQLVSEFDSVFNLLPTFQRCSTFGQWLCWSTFVSNHGGQMELKWHLRMSLSSFEKLLSFIGHHSKWIQQWCSYDMGSSFLKFRCIACYSTLPVVPTWIFFCWHIQTFILPCCMEDNVCNCPM